MDQSTRQGQSNEESGDTEERKNHANDESKTDFNNHRQRKAGTKSNYKPKQNRLSSKSQPTVQQNQRAVLHSRSRSPHNTSTGKHWISSNAFINFVQDFRQNFTGLRSARIFQLAGERWRQMSAQEKQPYVEAAKTIKHQRQEQRTNVQTNKPNTSTEHKKAENVRKQKEKKSSKEQKQNKKSENTDSDSDLATSGTAGTLTSEDMSD